jgi:hypothetical protein
VFVAAIELKEPRQNYVRRATPGTAKGKALRITHQHVGSSDTRTKKPLATAVT